MPEQIACHECARFFPAKEAFRVEFKPSGKKYGTTWWVCSLRCFDRVVNRCSIGVEEKPK